MKRKTINIILVVIIAVLVIGIPVGLFIGLSGSQPDGTRAPGEESAGLTLELNALGNGYEVTDMGTCKDRDVVVPKQYNSLPVVGIAENAFYRHGRDISSITLPEGLTYIGKGAFFECNHLSEVSLPNSLTDIAVNAFLQCFGIRIVRYNGTADSWCSITGLNYLMNTSSDKTLYLDSDRPTTEIALSSALSVPAGAFCRCTGITKVTIPASVTAIGNDAFYGCTGLTSIAIPSSVKDIGDSAFYGCSKLAGVSVPSGLKNLGNYAFDGCPLEYNEYGGAKYIGNDVDRYVVLIEAGNRDVTNIILHEKTMIIHSRAFKECRKLTAIDLPRGITAVADEAFYCCTSLARVTIPDGCKAIGEKAFQSCTSLTEISLPASVESLDFYAFGYCSELTKVEIANGDTNINATAFSECGKLAYNTYDNGLYLGNTDEKYLFLYKAKSTNIRSCTVHPDTKTICSGAFRDCSALTSVTLPDGLKRLGSYAFSMCTELTGVNIPSGITEIPDSAFLNCHAFTLVVVPDNVKRINSGAFAGCYNMSIILGTGIESIDEGVFHTNSYIYYSGARYDWMNIVKDLPSDSRPKKIYYYSATEPNDIYDDNFWHYAADGTTPVAWPKKGS